MQTVDYSPWTNGLASRILRAMQRNPALQESFGAVLRQLRVKKGLSQEDLALEADLDRTFVSMLERGLRQPTLSSLFALAQALRIPASRMVRLTEKGISSS